MEAFDLFEFWSPQCKHAPLNTELDPAALFLHHGWMNLQCILQPRPLVVHRLYVEHYLLWNNLISARTPAHPGHDAIRSLRTYLKLIKREVSACNSWITVWFIFFPAPCCCRWRKQMIGWGMEIPGRRPAPSTCCPSTSTAEWRRPKKGRSGSTLRYWSLERKKNPSNSSTSIKMTGSELHKNVNERK